MYERRSEGGRRICVDEFGPLNLAPRPGICWERGASRRPGRLPATYRRDGGVRHLLALYDLATGRLDGWFYERKRTDEFLDFLKRVRSRYPVEETLHVVLDNDGPHLSSRVLEWAEANKMLFSFPPTNASWLNRIECHFAALQKFALAGSYYRSHRQLQGAIESDLAWHNGERPIRAATPHPTTRTKLTAIPGAPPDKRKLLYLKRHHSCRAGGLASDRLRRGGTARRSTYRHEARPCMLYVGVSGKRDACAFGPRRSSVVAEPRAVGHRQRLVDARNGTASGAWRGGRYGACGRIDKWSRLGLPTLGLGRAGTQPRGLRT